MSIVTEYYFERGLSRLESIGESVETFKDGIGGISEEADLREYANALLNYEHQVGDIVELEDFSPDKAEILERRTWIDFLTSLNLEGENTYKAELSDSRKKIVGEESIK